MTFGDWIEKIVIAFGGKPSAVARCEKRIKGADARIKLIQEDYNRIFKENDVLHKQIEEKKRMLAREVVQANKQMLQMQMSVLTQNFEQKIKLATFLMNQLTNLNTLRGSIEISLAQVRTGVSPLALEMQLDEIDVVLEDAEEANKLGRVLEGKVITPTFRVDEHASTEVANDEKIETSVVQAEMPTTSVVEPTSSSNEMGAQTDTPVPQV